MLKKILYKIPPLKRTAVRAKEVVTQMQYKHDYGNVLAVDSHVVLFCAYSGRQYACSPKQLYLAMQGMPEYRDYTFIWAFNEPEKYEFLLADGRTLLVKYGSKEFKQALARAKYWISNSRIPNGIVKKPEQIYIQTWHGTPLKKLGFDVEHYIKGADDIKSLRRSYATDAKRFDYLLSPSPFYSEKMASAFHLDAMHRTDIILEEGYPRNDPLYKANPDEVAKLRRQLGIAPHKKVILYAPTWREEALNPAAGLSYSNGIGFHMAVDFKKLHEELGDDYVILLRTHYFVTRNLNFEDYGDFLINVSDYPEINDLYLVSDLLITDYSSVFFDYAVCEKPIIFYMYDLEKYRYIRDFYFPLEELPGPIVEHGDALGEMIVRTLRDFKVDEKYRAFNAKFNPHDTPCAERVLKKVIG